MSTDLGIHPRVVSPFLVVPWKVDILISVFTIIEMSRYACPSTGMGFSDRTSIIRLAYTGQNLCPNIIPKLGTYIR